MHAHYQNPCYKPTLSIGIFSLTESTSDKSISATTIPVDKRSEKGTQTKPTIEFSKLWFKQNKFWYCKKLHQANFGTVEFFTW